MTDQDSERTRRERENREEIEKERGDMKDSSNQPNFSVNTSLQVLLPILVFPPQTHITPSITNATHTHTRTKISESARAVVLSVSLLLSLIFMSLTCHCHSNVIGAAVVEEKICTCVTCSTS